MQGILNLNRRERGPVSESTFDATFQKKKLVLDNHVYLCSIYKYLGVISNMKLIFKLHLRK